MKNWYAIGEFSKKTGLSIKALRHYQELALLQPHDRGENGYRYYNEEQVPVAKRIKDYKKLGFSLEEISKLLTATSIKNLVEEKLQELTQQETVLSQQKSALQSILTSLETGTELSATQREVIMESIKERTIEGFKRRGIVPSAEMIKKIENEIQLGGEQQQKILAGVRQIMAKAKSLDVMLGPGRGSAGASLILFGEGYLPQNPLQYGLIPEIYSGATIFWLDVEFSRGKEIGELCRELEKEIKFPVVAFKCPFLDILCRVQKKVGTINFDSYADDSDVVLSAFKEKSLRGIWSFEWTPHFRAFQIMTAENQKKFARDQNEFEEWMQTYQIKNVEDILNISFMYGFRGMAELAEYQSLAKTKIKYAFLKPSSQKILECSHGLLLWREQWLQLLQDNFAISLVEGIKIHRAVVNKKTETVEFQKFASLPDSEVKTLLEASAAKTFLKSHIASGFWYVKRTAILKALWPQVYLETITEWEQEKGLDWQEFGYTDDEGIRHLEA